MPRAPDPSEIFRHAAQEGRRRLDQSMLELVSTSFIAGFTVVFGLVALGIVHALTEPLIGEASQVAGALAFGTGLVFLIVGRTELFTENFSDPIAALFAEPGAHPLRRLLRLWGVTLVFNLVGGALLILPLTVDGVLPEGTDHALSGISTELVRRTGWAGFVSAIVGGALVALLSFLLQGVRGAAGRIVLAYAVGVLLALGPFDHVIVTGLHLLFGVLFGASVGAGVFLEILAVATAGNLVGGVGLVTLSHVAQAKGANE